MPRHRLCGKTAFWSHLDAGTLFGLANWRDGLETAGLGMITRLWREPTTLGTEKRAFLSFQGAP
jgi:hypothetical protein